MYVSVRQSVHNFNCLEINVWSFQCDFLFLNECMLIPAVASRLTAFHPLHKAQCKYTQVDCFKNKTFIDTQSFNETNTQKEE